MKLLTATTAFVALCGIAVAHDWNHHDDHHHDHAKYEFKYGVKDSKTGDVKDQWEHRNGDHVKGAYSLKEADGTTRVVEYHADGHSGFHAHVKRLGHAHHPEGHHGHEHHHYGHHSDHHDDHHHGHHHHHHEVHHDHHAHHHGHYDHHGHGHGHGHGHATSYANFNLH